MTARIREEIVTAPMQAFVASLTAALLFIHTVFGCCWHHAQCSTAGVCEPAHCCHHHQHDSDGQQQERPCKCTVECEGTCIYVVPQKVTVEAPDRVAIDVLAVLPSLADCQIEAAVCWEGITSPTDLAPPMRTHLLHQVLLN
jgi:hypothetical protein